MHTWCNLRTIHKSVETWCLAQMVTAKADKHFSHVGRFLTSQRRGHVATVRDCPSPICSDIGCSSLSPTSNVHTMSRKSINSPLLDVVRDFVQQQQDYWSQREVAGMESCLPNGRLSFRCHWRLIGWSGACEWYNYCCN